MPYPVCCEQVFFADWYCGEAGLIPSLELPEIAPLLFGSGNFGNPWLRMQEENFSAATTFWLWDGCPLDDGPLAICAQSVCAVWNCVLCGSIPSWISDETAPWLFGSGNFGSPWERMHSENARVRPPDPSCEPPWPLPALRRIGIPLWPASLLTEARLVVGTAALLAVAAVLALAIGTILRRSALAITTAVVVIFVPYLLTAGPGQGGRSGWGGWLLRITPVAALSVQQSVPQFSQVIAIYRPNDGYYPLAPWAGFAVECAWAAAALALAYYLLRRRDA